MAIGGVPTMMDMDWATINANQRTKNMQNFKSEFLANIKQEVMALKPKLTWDGSNLKYENATDGSDNMLRAMTEEELWNRYSTAAKNRGIKTDLVYFENELKPVYQSMSTNSLSRQLQDLTYRGLDPKHFKKLYKDDVNFKKSLDYTINNTTDPTMQEGFRTLRPSVKEQGGIGVGQALGIGAGGVYGLSKLRKFQPTNKMGRFLKGAGPLGALVGGRMLAGAMGATEQQLDYADKGTSIGFPAYYGYQAIKDMQKTGLGKRGIQKLSSSSKSSELIKQAKALGINVEKYKLKPRRAKFPGLHQQRYTTGDLAGKYYTGGIQQEVDDKIKSQPVKKTRAQFKAKGIKGFKPPKIRSSNKLGLALSLLYPLISGEWFGGSQELAPETEDTRQPTDWSAYEKY